MRFIGIQLKIKIINCRIFRAVLPLNSGIIHGMIVSYKLGFNTFLFFCKINSSSSDQAWNNLIFLFFQISRVQSKASSFPVSVAVTEFSLQFAKEQTCHSQMKVLIYHNL